VLGSKSRSPAWTAISRRSWFRSGHPPQVLPWYLISGDLPSLIQLMAAGHGPDRDPSPALEALLL